MTKIYSILTAAFLLNGITACNNETSNKVAAKEDAAVLVSFVDSVDKLTPVYTVANWTSIDNAYQERALKAEKAMADMDDANKASIKSSKERYAALKLSYETQLKANESQANNPVASSPDYRQVLRNRLFGEGKIGTDMQFGFVTAENILSVYKNFVNVVADNKNNYTREDWDEVKVLYEALDTRKNAVEKDLASSDNLKIAGLKIKFAAIKGTHRGGTKGEENAKAKE